MLPTQLLKTRVQVGLKEPAEPRLVDDSVARLRLEFRKDVRVPGIADEDSALLAIRSDNFLSDSALRIDSNQPSRLDW
jgi:hypothetical protein